MLGINLPPAMSGSKENSFAKRIVGLQVAQAKYISTNLKTIRDLLQEIENVNDSSVDQIIGEPSSVIKSKLGSSQKRMTDGFKEYHIHISNFSKELDKLFQNKTPAKLKLQRPKVSSKSIIKRLIAQDLCRRACPLAVNALLCPTFREKENVDDQDTLCQGEKIYLREMSRVLPDLKKGDINSAEQWVLQNYRSLGRVVTYNLTFEIVRIRFLQLFKAVSNHENKLKITMKFAVEVLSMFYTGHEQDIQTLLMLLLYDGLSFSTAVVPSVEDCINELIKSISVQCAKIHELPGNEAGSNLNLLLDVGTGADSTINTALTFVYNSETKKIKGTDDDSLLSKTLFDLEASGLPVDFKIKPENRFHSSFCCPVTRQPATQADPPALLACGHAILQSSMKSLPRRHNKFKCPTCYGVSEDSDVLILTI